LYRGRYHDGRSGGNGGLLHGVKIAHIEAGLRTYDPQQPFPEEMNRRVTTLAATLHFASTERARENLLREGIRERDIILTGNTVVDALRYIEQSSVLNLETALPQVVECTCGLALDREGFADLTVHNAAINILKRAGWVTSVSAHVVAPEHTLLRSPRL